MTESILADRRHVLYGVKIIIERQLIDNVWQSHRWVIHDLVPLNLRAGDGPPPSNNIHFERLRQRESGEEALSLFIAEASLDLHGAEAEAYADNLASAEPSIYAVFRKNEEDDENADQDVDIHLAEISLSPYNIQDYEDCGEDQIEKLPLHGPIADFVREFVDIHFKPEPFIKRKRDKARVERDQIGGADPRLKARGHSFKISSAKNSQN